MLPGIASRIEIELRGLQFENLKFRPKRSFIEVVDKHFRNSAFIGAIILSSLANNNCYDDYWISKKDWEEVGPNIINKKNVLNFNEYSNLK